MQKHEFVVISTAIASSNFLYLYPEMTKLIEQQLKERISTLNLNESIFMLKAFCQAQEGSIDGFYKLFERNIAKFASYLSDEELYIALKSFYNVN